MPTATPRLLSGPYHPPRCRMGGWLTCRLRGRPEVVALRNAPIGPRPVVRIGDRGRDLILCGDLVRAVQRESAAAVMHWWSVRLHTVWKWRQALVVDQYNPGTRALHPDPTWLREGDVLQRRRDALQRPETRTKVAAGKRGKPRPAHVVEALRQANRGCKLSEEHRRKIGATNRRKGIRPPAAGQPWAPAEDELVRQDLAAAEVAQRPGRTV